jgi:hypothetical protein
MECAYSTYVGITTQCIKCNIQYFIRLHSYIREILISVETRVMKTSPLHKFYYYTLLLLLLLLLLFTAIEFSLGGSSLYTSDK